MTTRRSGGSDDNKTELSSEGNAGQKPRGVRPPARGKPSMATKTMQSNDTSGGAPTRFSAATRVFGEETQAKHTNQKAARSVDKTTRVAPGSMSGGETVLASSFSDDSAQEDAKSNANPRTAKSVSDDPVHGWFVVADGPGKGNSIHVGSGRSAIGRDKSQHISVDFGDGTISREKHCWVTFDGREGKFYLSVGDGRNLCYVNDAPVLTSLLLQNRDTIQIGETTLVFIAFCGNEFSW